MASNRDTGYLTDILDASQDIRKIIAGKTFAEFDNSHMAPLAVAKLLEIIGEATKNLSASIRNQHPSTPWKKMASLRDILVHRYRETNNELLFKIAQDDIPKLATEIKAIISTKK